MAPSALVQRTKTGYRVAARSRVPHGLRVPGPQPFIVERGAQIQGGLFAGGTIFAQPNVTVHGPVRTFGDLVLGAFSTIGGDLQAGGAVHVLPGSRIVGAIEAVGDVHLFDGSVVRGRVRAGGDIAVYGSVRAQSIRPGGRVRTEPFQVAPPMPGAAPGQRRDAHDEKSDGAAAPVGPKGF